MRETWQPPLRSQFGAALLALEHAIVACPDPLWDAETRSQRFWYIASHTLFWLDYYLADSADEFAPPAPFGLEEFDPAGVMPPRTYTKAELLEYLAHGRRRLVARLDALDDAGAARPCGFPGKDMSVLELMLYNLRHVQHHAGQLQVLLRQAGHEPPRWVKRGSP
jgi:hypothetical protein